MSVRLVAFGGVFISNGTGYRSANCCVVNLKPILSSKREFFKINNVMFVILSSPTMAGGLLAADRKYFFEVGGYDPGMDIWGGENLELSFRVIYL